MVLEGNYQLGDWLVRPHTNTVVGPEGELHMEPKAMRVLSLLAERAGQVVTKQEILAEVWDGTFVSDEVLPNAVWEIRRVLGDDARKPIFIQTLPKKGYRLIVSVSPAASDPAPAENERPSWSRWRWPLVAALAAALFAGAVAVRTHRSEATRSARTAEDPYPVFVAAFENHTGSDELTWLESGAPTMLRTALAEIPGLTVVSDESLERALTETGDSSATHLSVARRAGAEAVVLGSIFRAGGELRIDVQVEDVVESRIVAAHSVRGEDVFSLMDDLTAWVRDSLARSDAAGASPIQPIRDMTTTSLEAFRLYNAGVVARRHLRVADARRLLGEAVAIDPGFVLAYLELQWVALWTNDEAGHEEYVAKALEHEDRLPPQKRFLMQAQKLWEEGARDRAEAILLSVIERQPDEEDAYLHLAHLYGSTDPDRALTVLERGVSTVPHSGYLRLNYGYGLLWAGRFTEAIHQLELYAELNPEEPNPWDSLGEAYLIAGVPERALEHYRRALEVDASFPSSYLGRSWALAQLGRYDEALHELASLSDSFPPGYTAEHLAIQKAYLLSRVGRYREANRLVEDLASSSGETPSPAALLLQALLAIEANDPSRGLVFAEEARRELTGADASKKRHWAGSFAELLSGIAACRVGRMDEAETRLESLRAHHRPDVARESWWVHLLAGEIELARGEARAAYLAFTSGEPERKMKFSVSQLFEDLSGSLSLRDATARARAAEGNAAAAIEIYGKLLRPDIGQRWTAVLEPRYHLEIARLHAREGDREEATRHYREFLDLWSKADPDLPELREAEAYLASS